MKIHHEGITKVAGMCLLGQAGMLICSWFQPSCWKDPLVWGLFWYLSKTKNLNPDALWLKELKGSKALTLPYIVLNIFLICWRWSLERWLRTSIMAFSSVPENDILISITLAKKDKHYATYIRTKTADSNMQELILWFTQGNAMINLNMININLPYLKTSSSLQSAYPHLSRRLQIVKEFKDLSKKTQTAFCSLWQHLEHLNLLFCEKTVYGCWTAEGLGTFPQQSKYQTTKHCSLHNNRFNIKFINLSDTYYPGIEHKTMRVKRTKHKPNISLVLSSLNLKIRACDIWSYKSVTFFYCITGLIRCIIWLHCHPIPFFHCVPLGLIILHMLQFYFL